MEKPSKEELKARIEAYGRSMHSAGYNEKAHLPRMRDACFSDASRFLTEIIDALFAEVPTEPMTPAALNLALAGLLEVDLTAREDGSDNYHMAARWFKGHADLDVVDPAFREWARQSPQVYPDILDFVWQQRGGTPWQQSIEVFHAAWRRAPPDYATDLVTAFTLGEELGKQGRAGKFVYFLRLGLGFDVPCPACEFAICHASAYDRSLAAFRAMGGTE